MGKLGFTKIKNFCSSKDSVKGTKICHILGENICKNTYLIKDLSKIYKVVVKLNNRKTNNPIKKWAKSEQILHQRRSTKWQIGIWKDVQHPMTLGNCKLKQWWDAIIYLLQQLKSQNWHTNCKWGYGATETLIVGWECKMVQSLWKTFGSFLQS